MSAESIYIALRKGGLSPAGAAAVMGNMDCESRMRSNNVEDRCPVSDEEYTASIDNGTRSRQSFMRDAYGYGLCQWTYYTRKAELYDLAKFKGVSIANEEMQCEFCLIELRKMPDLYKFLCETNDIKTASDRVCKEYERPAVNNLTDRSNASMNRYNALRDIDVGGTSETINETVPMSGEASCECTLPVLRKGHMGRAVFMAQSGLNDMGFNCGKADGDFGKNTESAVIRLKSNYGLPTNGEIDADVWQILFQ